MRVSNLISCLMVSCALTAFSSNVAAQLEFRRVGIANYFVTIEGADAIRGRDPVRSVLIGVTLHTYRHERRLWWRESSTSHGVWREIGPATNIVAVTGGRDSECSASPRCFHFFAATRYNQLIARPNLLIGANWRPIGHANNVVAMTTVYDHFWAATSDNKLWIRRVVMHDVPWQHVGHANNVIAMTFVGR